MTYLTLRAAAPAIVLAACLAGCAADAPTVARDAFVAAASCPADRVTVTRGDGSAPPPDVAADPGRLAVWRSAQENGPNFIARGCNQERRYSCVAINYTSPPYSYKCADVR